MREDVDVEVDVAAGTVLQVIAAATGLRFERIGLLTGGEGTGLVVAGEDGRRWIVKWQAGASDREALRRAVPLVAQLAQAGWPVGEQRLIDTPGATIVLRQRLPGTDVTVLTDELLDAVLALHERRLGIAATADPSWPAHLIETLRVGGTTYCRHDVVRGGGRRAARLVDLAVEIGASLEPEDLVGRDIVHCDLHPGNLLQRDGRLSGVIDTDYVAVGDAAFDLVTLSLSASELTSGGGAAARLHEAAFDGLDETRRRPYLAHLAIRFLHWPILGRRPAEVELWLDRFEPLLGL
jgi:hypothetical protein